MIFFTWKKWKCLLNVSFFWENPFFTVSFHRLSVFGDIFVCFFHLFSFSLETLFFSTLSAHLKKIEWSEDLQVTNNDSAFKCPIAFFPLHPLLFFVKNVEIIRLFFGRNVICHRFSLSVCVCICTFRSSRINSTLSYQLSSV